MDIEDTANGEKGTILLVDDEQQVRGTVREYITNNGYHVVEAASGQEGLEAYRRGSFGLIVSDVLMPDMTGVAMFQQLKGEYPNAKIIFFSGAPGNEKTNIANLVSSGDALFLTKPLDLPKLPDAIKAMYQR